MYECLASPAVSKTVEPWVCKLINSKREAYLREKKEKRVKRTSAQSVKELAIRVRKS